MNNTSRVIDISHLQTWVGREKTVVDDLSADKARALSAALEREDYRPALPESGSALPPCWQWIYFVDTPSALTTSGDGHPKTGGFLPPVPLPRRMWAAGNFAIHLPVLLGTPAHKRSVVSSVDLKQGATGTLVFVTVRHTIEQAGRICMEEEQNIVYREMPAEPSPLAPGKTAPKDTDWVIDIRPDPVLLFRYSALTYNGHRIHYDRQYAIEEEFYPALVLHGPLQATLLANCARQFYADTELSQLMYFSFRALRPLFDTDCLSLCGKRDGNTLSLWTRSHEGFVGMTATAQLGEGKDPL